MTRRAARPLDQPHPARFLPSAPGYAAALTAHREAMERGEDGYVDPTTGYFVFTAAHLASRDCCDCGCRHCPYFEQIARPARLVVDRKVREPRRSP